MGVSNVYILTFSADDGFPGKRSALDNFFLLIVRAVASLVIVNLAAVSMFWLFVIICASIDWGVEDCAGRLRCKRDVYILSTGGMSRIVPWVPELLVMWVIIRIVNTDVLGRAQRAPPAASMAARVWKLRIFLFNLGG